MAESQKKLFDVSLLLSKMKPFVTVRLRHQTSIGLRSIEFAASLG
jgi:hypothetical protein